jgi:hypothetical protein
MDEDTMNDGIFSLRLEEILSHYLEKNMHTINKSRKRVKKQYFHISQKPNVVSLVLTSQVHQDVAAMLTDFSIYYLKLFYTLD